MKLLAIVLIIISFIKLILSFKINSFDTIAFKEISNIIDPNAFRNIACAMLTCDGLIGLFCGLFILFMM